MENSMEVSLEAKKRSTIQPCNPTPEEIKIERDACIPLFTAALFTTARTWNQRRCPLTDE